MSSPSSVISLSPASAAFVNARTTTLGPWVLGAFLDCILLGVILCQTFTFFQGSPPATTNLRRYYRCLVITVVFLSILKTSQLIGIVWVQNVKEFANPDVARTLVAKAWFQVSVPLMTGVIGAIVQSFYCLRFYMLSESWMFCVPIVCAICVGLAGVSMSLACILNGNSTAKVMWLLVHLVAVFVGDLLNTVGTIYSLKQRHSELARTNQLINRLLRLVFESALPPTILAMADLVMTQTLGRKLLWHLFINMALGKVYVLSLLYTLNSINCYRVRDKYSLSQEANSYGRSKRSNMELTPRVKTDVFIQTQVSTHISPASFSPMPNSTREYSDIVLQETRDDVSSERACYEP